MGSVPLRPPARPAREIAREIAHAVYGCCSNPPDHGRACDVLTGRITAAIEARDAEAEAREAGLREALAHALVCSGSPADCDDCRDAAAPATTPRSGTAAATKEGG